MTVFVNGEADSNISKIASILEEIFEIIEFQRNRVRRKQSAIKKSLK